MAPYIAKWGVIGAGWISSMFVDDIALERPDVTDVLHAVTAVGSRDKTKAAEFIEKHLPKGATAQQAGLAPMPVACGSYQEVFEHPNVDIVYIGTLHPTHYEDAKAALEAGKHVLVEKPATLNAAEWVDLVRIATERKLFIMEAFWTRFQPAVQALYDALHVEKVIGDIQAVHTDFSVPNYNKLPDDHRIIGLAAAGGPLLDLGAYTMVPARIALSDNPDNKGEKPVVTCAMSKTRMGTDLATTIVLDYPALGPNGAARAVCNTSFATRYPRDVTATILGTGGEVYINTILCRITKFTIIKFTPGASREEDKWEEPRVVEMDIKGMGLNLEADAVARDIRDGKLENGLVTHKYTTETLEIFDECRRQGDYILPEGMEKVGRVVA